LPRTFFFGSSPGSCGRNPTEIPSAGNASEVLVLARHDSEERALARAVQAEDTDLRAGEKRQPDIS
jgi:hypothetical protein